jgi:hypothetical protein
MKKQCVAVLALSLAILSQPSLFAAEIKVQKTTHDLSKEAFDEVLWKDVKSENVSLMAQPMAIPRPKTTNTSALQVQSLQDGKWIAFRLKWHADQKAEAGKLGEFSDAIAIQFPVKEGSPPPIFMGAKDNPVHIFHWRAQYQRDLEKGKPEMKDLYPNMNPDMYPMEFKDPGHVKGLTEEKREVYSPGKAEGNPQSYTKASAVDEIFAEGFGSSSVIENRAAIGKGTWNKGEWSVVIARPLKRENGSVLDPTKDSFVAFAVWQGAKQEVGARKCVTMAWVPLQMNSSGGNQK